MVLHNQLGVLALCYVLLFMLSLWAWQMKSENLVSGKVLNGNWIVLHVRHAGGILIMAAIPAVFLPVTYEGVFLWPGFTGYVQTLTLTVAAFLLVMLVVKNRKGLATDKPVNDKDAPLHAMLYIVFRSCFLICYEFFFRGWILFSCIDLFGILPAIIINLALFALIHSFNGKKQVHGSIPLGLILCLFTIWFQSVWPAILLHLLLSSFHESIFLSPFLWKKTKSAL